MQPPDGLEQVIAKLLTAVVLGVVGVARKNLVGALADENRLDVLAASVATRWFGTLLCRSMGSKDSIIPITSGTSSMAFSPVKTVSSWWLPMCSATWRAARRSGLSANPAANVRNVHRARGRPAPRWHR